MPNLVEIVTAIEVAHGETTVSSGTLLALARELRDCWREIEKLEEEKQDAIWEDMGEDL